MLIATHQFQQVLLNWSLFCCRRYGAINYPFTAPVAEVYPAIPADYDTIVSRRMDLRTIKSVFPCNSPHNTDPIYCFLLINREALDRDYYLFFKDFLADVKLVFDNALLYNKGLKGLVNGEYELAAAMMRTFEREWGGVLGQSWREHVLRG